MPDAGCRMPDAGYRDTGYRIQIQDAGYLVLDSKF